MEKLKFRILKDQSILDEAAADVAPGHYKLYEPFEKLPSYLHPRGRYGNTCVLVLATTCNPNFDLHGYKPSGNLHYVLTFRDDLDRSHQQEFNKDVQLIFKNTDGKPCIAHLYDPSEHSISAVATGTSLRFLKKNFRLPDAKTGTIDDLIECNTSIGPYPTDCS